MDKKLRKENKDTVVIEAVVAKADLDEVIKTVAEKQGSEDEAANREAALQFEAMQLIQEAVTEEGLKLATQPEIKFKDEKDGDVLITIICTLVPDVDLGKYTGFDVLKEEVNVSDEEVLEYVMQQVNSQEMWEDVDRAAKENDQVLIDFIGVKDGVPFDGGSAENYPLVLGSHSFIPGFEEQLIGIKKEEQKEVNVSFPEDYFEPSLAGAPVVFQITCHAVQEKVEPQLNDAFVEKLGMENVKTVEDFKAAAKEHMHEVKEQEAKNKQALEILDKVVEDAKVDVPQAMIDQQVEQELGQLKQQIQQYGMQFDQYLEMAQTTEEDLKKQIEPQAIMQIKQALILIAIAEKEQIEASQEEIAQEYEVMSNVYRMPKEQLQMFISDDVIRPQIIQRKTLDFLTKNNSK